MQHGITMEAVERHQLTRPHILVVNGESSFLNLMRDLLQDEEYNVTTTNFVPETLEQVIALNPGVLIIDLAVGKRSGWDLLERLHATAATAGIPVIVVSTQPAYLTQAREQVARYGAVGLLSKPFNLEDMLSLIEVALVSLHADVPA